jgi:hypothetical protein
MFTKVEAKSASKDRTCFSGSNSLIRQVHSPHPRGECLPQHALSLGWVPIQSPALIGLNLPLMAIAGIVERGKKLTCTQDIYKAKLERLHSARLIRRDQKATLYTCRVSNDIKDS